MIAEVTEGNFEQEVIKSQLPVVVDFWAPDCAPCAMLEPILTSLNDRLGDSVKIMSVNIQESRDLALRYGVRSIPTLLFFKGDKVFAQVVGNVDEEEILTKIVPLL